MTKWNETNRSAASKTITRENTETKSAQLRPCKAVESEPKQFWMIADRAGAKLLEPKPKPEIWVPDTQSYGFWGKRFNS